MFVNLTDTGATLSFTRPKECTKYHSLVLKSLTRKSKHMNNDSTGL